MARRESLTHLLRPHHRKATTLVECLVAIVILAVATMGFFPALVAGQRHLIGADERLRAVRIAEQVMEEVLAEPLLTSAWPRSTWTLDEFDGLHQEAGALRDCSNEPYPITEQGFSCDVTVQAVTLDVTELGGPQQGRHIAVTVTSVKGESWSLERFVSESAL